MLRFDFAVFCEKGSLRNLIEYDGKQHFEPIEFFGGIESYNQLKVNDDKKEKYCKENNIKLIRIPYYDKDNIETTLRTNLQIS